MARRRTQSSGLPQLRWAGCYFYPSRSAGKGYRLVVVEKATGRRKEITLQSRDVDAAYREADEIAFRYHRGMDDPFDTTDRTETLRATVERYLSEQAAWEPQTRYKARQTLNRFLATLPSTTPATKVTERDVRRFCLHGDLAPTTQRDYYAKLRQFFRYAVDRGLIEESPCRMIATPKASRPHVRPLLRGEYEHLLSCACLPAERGHHRHLVASRLALAIRIGVGAGLRRVELCALRWQDVDPARSALTVRGYTMPWQGSDVRFRPKTGRDRTVPLFGSLADVLSEARGHATTPFVLTPTGTRRVSPDRLAEQFARVRDRAGLGSDVSLHALRHTFVSWLLEAGVPPVRIREYTGHASLKAFESYAHYLPTTRHERENSALP